jgi:hypothetical protein
LLPVNMASLHLSEDLGHTRTSRRRHRIHDATTTLEHERPTVNVAGDTG